MLCCGLTALRVGGCPYLALQPPAFAGASAGESACRLGCYLLAPSALFGMHSLPGSHFETAVSPVDNEPGDMGNDKHPDAAQPARRPHANGEAATGPPAGGRLPLVNKPRPVRLIIVLYFALVLCCAAAFIWYALAHSADTQERIGAVALGLTMAAIGASQLPAILPLLLRRRPPKPPRTP